MDVIRRAKKCLDTYALVELAKDNADFAFLYDTPFLVPDLALAELYDVLFRKKGKAVAEEWHAKLNFYGVPVPNALLKQAVEMRRTSKKANFSLTDTAGYMLAQHLGLPFVTGDKSFKDLPGVDFRPAQQTL
jgi:predicted nucleic acid-binding protein